MPKENFNKAIEIYEDLSTAVMKSDSIFKLAMKYVPLSTKDGIELHRRYDELVRLLNNITNKKY
jgi:hypothetical protein